MHCSISGVTAARRPEPEQLRIAVRGGKGALAIFAIRLEQPVHGAADYSGDCFRPIVLCSRSEQPRAGHTIKGCQSTSRIMAEEGVVLLGMALVVRQDGVPPAGDVSPNFNQATTQDHADLDIHGLLASRLPSFCISDLDAVAEGPGIEPKRRMWPSIPGAGSKLTQLRKAVAGAHDQWMTLCYNSDGQPRFGWTCRGGLARKQQGASR